MLEVVEKTENYYMNEEIFLKTFIYKPEVYLSDR